MLRKRRVLISLITICCMLSSIPFNAFANDRDFSKVSGLKEIYVDNELGGTIERIVKKGSVEITWESFDGTEKYTALRENGKRATLNSY